MWWRRSVFALSLLLTCARPTTAAPVHDAVSTAADFLVSSLTWSHTTTGADRLLFVGVSIEGTTVSGVTYNAVALTLVSAVTNASYRAELWRLIAPATGANNIVVTLAAQATAVVGGGESVTGAHQTTPTGTPATATGATTTPTVDVTAATDDLVIDSLSFDTRGGIVITVGAGQTERWNTDVNIRLRGAGSTEPGAATVTMSWTADFGQSWAIVGVAIKPAAATAAAPQRSLLGVGL